MDYRVVLGSVAAVFSFVGYIPYFWDIFKGKTKPHAFSWLVWGTLTGIATVGSIYDNGAAGAWSMGVSSVLCLTGFVLALKWGEKNITKSDWLCLICAMISIVLWLITKGPLISVILVALTDLFGSIPTFRKAYIKPYEETQITYLFSVIHYVLAIVALGHYSLITVLYPAVLIFIDGSMVAMLSARRMKV